MADSNTLLRTSGLFWKLAVVASVVAAILACGPSEGIRESTISTPTTPANQSHHYEGWTMVVAWDASDGATHYKVYYSDFHDDSCGVSTGGRPAFCRQLAGDVVGTSYIHTSPDRDENQYWVVACNSSGCSEIDSSTPARLNGPAMPEGVICDRSEVIPGSPSVPDVSVSWDGPDVRISWVPSPGAIPTYYNILYRARSRGWIGCKYLLADNLTETTYAHRDQVKPIPNAPRAAHVTDRTSDSLTIEWRPSRVAEDRSNITYSVTACNDAGCSDSFREKAQVGVPLDTTHFELQRGSPEDPAGSDMVAMEIATGGKYRDDGLQPGSVYSYELRACNDTGCSSPTPVAGLTEAVGAVDVPSAPTNIRGRKVDVFLDTDDAEVFWDEVDGATYYEVYQGANYDAEVSAPKTSYYDRSPDELVGRFIRTTYRVKACNKSGCSPLSRAIWIR